mgnify:FL=1
MILVNPIARTRALYKWEADDLDHRDEAWRNVWTVIRGQEIIRDIWKHKWGRSCIPPAPTLELRPIKGHAYCQGRTRIVLTLDDATELVLLHELAHAMRGGSIRNPHSVWFVRCYIKLMWFWFGWHQEELEFQAMTRGLI